MIFDCVFTVTQNKKIMKKIIVVLVLSFISGIGGAYFYNKILNPHEPNARLYINDTGLTTAVNDQAARSRMFTGVKINGNIDFVEASAMGTSSVVYIKNISSKTYGYSFFDWYFGEGGRSVETVSSGSGVILTKDGYIVTNNHVVKGADKLEVDYNRKSYDATLIGVDPSSDLAVIKIEGNNFPFIKTGHSKDVQVGQWVLAIGNPFNLTSTVTAGIVSAKGRDLNIMEDKFPIESFIQTDAAINPGNSGGALINTSGELIGINTAILSRTGSYAGYGFAIPVDIVKKVVNDLIDYGEVQKAFIGAGVTNLTSEVIKNLYLKVDEDKIRGVVINQIQRGGAAEKAGLKEGDIILEIDSYEVTSHSKFEEIIGYYSPGNIVSVNLMRKNKPLVLKITLTNREGTTDILKREVFSSDYLGADLEAVSKVERDILDIDYGVKVLKVYNKGLLANLGLEEGFIITYINYTKIKKPQDLAEVLSNYRGRVKMEGVDASGRKGYYTFYMR